MSGHPELHGRDVALSLESLQHPPVFSLYIWHYTSAVATSVLETQGHTGLGGTNDAI